jgi:hypothetical protein
MEIDYGKYSSGNTQCSEIATHGIRVAPNLERKFWKYFL